MASPQQSKNVLITGADRGIGFGLVKHYADRGDHVIGTTRRQAPGEALASQAESQPGEVKIMSLDAADEASIAAFGEALRADGHSLDLVINNAAISLGEPFGEWTADHFAQHFQVNTIAPALIVQAIRPCLRAGSTVINMTSGMASAELNIGPDNPLDAYAASKCALNILNCRLAEKLRPDGVTLVAMSPGWVQTEMGGPGATDTVDQAITKMTATIAKLGIQQTGAFIGPEGNPCPW